MSRRNHVPGVTTSLLAVALAACSEPILAPEAVVILQEEPAYVGAIVPLYGTSSTDPNDPALPLSFHWRLVSAPVGSTAPLLAVDQPVASIVPDEYGDYTVALVVDNGLLTSPEDSAVFNVMPCGKEPPEVDGITAEPAAPNADTEVRLAAAVSDPDVAGCGQDALIAYDWMLAAVPTGSHATLSDAGAPEPWLGVDIPGTYTIELTVTDATGLDSAPGTLELEVSTCGSAAPQIVAAPFTPEDPGIGELVSFEISAEDADNAAGCEQGQVLGIGAAFLSLPAGSKAELAPADGVNPAFVADVAGTYALRFTVSDGTGRSSFLDVPVVVSACGGHAPRIDAVTQAPDGPGIGDLVMLTIEASDADNDEPCSLGQTLDVWSQIIDLPAGSATTLEPSVGYAPAFRIDVEGTYTVRTWVVDGTGLSGFADTVVSASSCGGFTPTVVSVTPSSADPYIGETLSFEVVTADDDVDVCGLDQTLSVWSAIVHQPAGSTAVLAPDVGSSPALVPDVAGDYTLRTWVEDDTGRSSFLDTDVTVSACGGYTPTVLSVTPSSADPYIGETLSFEVVTADDDVDVCGLDQTLSVWSEIVDQPAGSTAVLAPDEGSSPALVPDVAGDYTLRTWVEDDTGRSSSLDTDVTVSECGGYTPEAMIEVLEPVTGGPGAMVTVSGAMTGFTVALDGGSSTDADITECGLDEVLTYAWSLYSMPAGSTAELNDPDITNPSFEPDMSGEYVVRLTVSDGTHDDDAWAMIEVERTSTLWSDPDYTLTWVDGESSLWSDPRGVAVDGTDVYVVQNGIDAVTVTDVTDGTTTLVSLGGYLLDPQDIVYYPTGDYLYVTSNWFDAVVRLTTDGEQAAYTSGTLDDPRGIALLSSTLVVADEDNGRLRFYSASATSLPTSSTGSEDFGGWWLTNPWGALAWTSGSTTYYVTTSPPDDAVYKTNGTSDVLIAALEDPRDVVRGSSGALYVADPTIGWVVRLSDCFSTRCATITPLAWGDWAPYGLAFLDAGTLLITDGEGDSLYTLTGTF